MTNHLGGHCFITHTDEGVVGWLWELYKHKKPTFLDVGCSMGWQMTVAHERGFKIQGIEGDITLQKNTNLHNKEYIIWHDLTISPLILAHNFDVIWCVEVAEHIEERYIDNLLKTLCFNLDKQGALVFTFCDKPNTGIHHVNIQNEDYWLKQFERYGLYKDESMTANLKKHSTMKREFIQESGIILRRA